MPLVTPTTTNERLHHLLLEILVSARLAATTHADGPYFGLRHAEKICWQTTTSEDVSPGLLQILHGVYTFAQDQDHRLHKDEIQLN
jgi:hypothetical protein